MIATKTGSIFSLVFCAFVALAGQAAACVDAASCRQGYADAALGLNGVQQDFDAALLVSRRGCDEFGDLALCQIAGLWLLHQGNQTGDLNDQGAGLRDLQKICMAPEHGAPACDGRVPFLRDVLPAAEQAAFEEAVLDVCLGMGARCPTASALWFLKSRSDSRFDVAAKLRDLGTSCQEGRLTACLIIDDFLDRSPLDGFQRVAVYRILWQRCAGQTHAETLDNIKDGVAACELIAAANQVQAVRREFFSAPETASYEEAASLTQAFSWLRCRIGHGAACAEVISELDQESAETALGVACRFNVGASCLHVRNTVLGFDRPTARSDEQRACAFYHWQACDGLRGDQDLSERIDEFLEFVFS